LSTLPNAVVQAALLRVRTSTTAMTGPRRATTSISSRPIRKFVATIA
jgi:hypothetical protein